MRRRVLAVMLTFALAAGSLAGCASNTSGPEKQGEPSKNTDTQAAEAGKTQDAKSETPEFAMDSDHYNLILRYYENVANTEIRDVAIDQLLKFELGNTTAREALNTIQAKADEVLGEGYAD